MRRVGILTPAGLDLSAVPTTIPVASAPPASAPSPTAGARASAN
jgi:hypothetical protein